MTVLYSGTRIAVVEKEAGENCEYSDSEKSLPRALEKKLGKKIYPVHRLDERTSGLVVFALDSEAAADLSLQIQNGVFKKEYSAVIEGTPEPSSGTLEDLLFFDRTKNKSFVVKKERKGVKKALLDYETVFEKDGFSTVRVFLKTGRTHQIRVQFASRKHPVVGDGKYGSKTGGPLMLRCVKIAFVSPECKKPVSFVSSSDFASFA